MMVRISFKLVVLIVSSLGFAAYLSWTNEYVAPYRNPQEPFKNEGRIDGGKRETHNESSSEDLNPKVAWQLEQHKLDNIQQVEESQETSNHRRDSKYNSAPQLNEIKVESIENKDTDTVQSSQGNDVEIERVTTKQDDERIQTFFSTLGTGFLNLGLEADQGILTLDFLKACQDLAPFFDKIGKATMSVARHDLTNNARKINTVYERDPDASQTLQKLVLTEFENGDFEVDGKGTISLLWLKRGLEFLSEFLHRLSDGEEPSEAANTAYDNQLYQHHGYFIRSAFKLGIKTLQYRKDFIKTLAVNREDASLPNFDQIISEDMANYYRSLEKILRILSDFYTKQGLNN